MSARPNYDLDIAYIEQNRDKIARGLPVDVQIRDNEDLSWKYVKALLSQSSEHGGEPVELVHTETSFDKAGEKWYIKILEELAD